MKHTLFLFLLVSFFVKSVAQPKFYPSNFVSSNFWMCSEFRFGYELPVSDKKHTIEPILFAAVPSVFGLIFNSIPSFSTGNFHSYFGGGGGMAYRYYFIKEKGVNPFLGTSLTASAYSTTFNFYTEGIAVINYLPFLPSLIQPEINATILGATASLKWFASDVDASDVLTYDVFLGTTNPPTIKVLDNKGDTTFNATSLQATTIYYWRVVVKDNKGGETRGQVWNFKTN